MRLTFWGTRGSLPVPGPGNLRYGGNTSCIQVETGAENIAILDAGTGIFRLGKCIGPETTRVDLLLSHLHMDHILGLGFFAALFRPEHEVHIWGPGSEAEHLRARLARYLSPPLFPLELNDLPCRPILHDISSGSFEIPGLEVRTEFVCHPGPTVGYRLSDGASTVAYLPDHEPALGSPPGRQGSPGSFADDGWTSGLALANGVDVLIHDAQYTDEEYAERLGWGHSSLTHTLAFAEAAGVRRLVPFHHDPSHDDGDLDRLFASAGEAGPWPFELTPATEELSLDVVGVKA